MIRFFKALSVAAVISLAACSTTPPPPPAPIAQAPRTYGPPTNYEWTNGFSATGYEAMHAMLGRTNLRPGEFHWAQSIPAEGEVAITVDIANQVAFVFKGSQLIGVTNVSTGKKGHPTPLGFWTINFKREKYFSRKYDNAPMPWMQNIDDKGIAFHGGKTPGYPASHGCIRLPMPFAKQLFTLTKKGNKVVIEG
ncbi:L,D-transpeptidase family protein [Sphingomonas sp. LY160]|uniref:L,D-transpeptidase family protein n=1 Tax=Sphingomonas sp. LY160 TaxID=3095342 RepID=UPI002ADEAA68|nr:L,D-transpeptidase family protein [Sphingomonas sp. LY160]MEA1072786.1 L,D-transpeptidase family protein [Sphingomonas sp. LY160]